ncbi:MAG: Arm DNA-binding domain-containing protein [Janthinobacterium lividum]
MYKKGLNQLSAVRIAKLTDPGLYADGGGLGFQITPTGVRSWVYRFMIDGKARKVGLGPYPAVSLALACEAAAACRAQVGVGIDLNVARDAERVAMAPAPRLLTFDDCAKKFIEAMTSLRHSFCTARPKTCRCFRLSRRKSWAKCATRWARASRRQLSARTWPVMAASKPQPM